MLNSILCTRAAWIWIGFGLDFDFVLGLDWILDSKYFMDLDMDLDLKVPWIWTRI